jgi:hypothetical protein
MFDKIVLQNDLNITKANFDALQISEEVSELVPESLKAYQSVAQQTD